MKILRPITLALIVLAVGCDNKTDTSAPPKGEEQTPSPAHGAPSVAPTQFAGVVTETMNSGGYTYIEFEHAGKRLWAAVPEMTIARGDTVAIPAGAGSIMANFASKSLNRTFESIIFASEIQVNGRSASKPAAKPAEPKIAEPIAVEKVEGGYTIEELFAQRESLKGQKIKVRGKVVKVSQGIMGRNWVHLRDGTGKADDKSDDLTLTTKDVANVGDVVVMEGIVAIDKDFGAGYAYRLIVEEAAVVK